MKTQTSGFCWRILGILGLLATASAAAGQTIPGTVVRGACCLQDRTCMWTTSADCVASGGSPRAAFSVCDAIICNPVVPQTIGACCRGTACEVTTLTNCAAIGGRTLGVGSTCTSNACRPSIVPVPGEACCLTDGSCRFDTVTNCRAIGGTAQGAGTTCTNSGCRLSITELAERTDRQSQIDCASVCMAGNGSLITARVSYPAGTPSRIVAWRVGGDWASAALPAGAVDVHGVSADGSRVVVETSTPSPGPRNALWIPGQTTLTPFGTARSSVYAVSPTGRAIVGAEWNSAANGYRMARWSWLPSTMSWIQPQPRFPGGIVRCTSEGHYLARRGYLHSSGSEVGFSSRLGDLQKQNLALNTAAFTMTADGWKVFGADRGVDADRLLIWNRSRTPSAVTLPGFFRLGAPDPSSSFDQVGSYTMRCTGDGSVVIGNGHYPHPSRSPSFDAWVLTGSPRPLRSALAQQFPALNLNGWELSHLREISVDGKTLVGVDLRGGRPRCWVIRLPSALR